MANIIKLDGTGRWTSTARRSSRPMTAGRRSTTSCSAACSARAARRRSQPPTRSAAACSRSASAPASRCRNTRRICASSAPTFPRRCCRRRRKRVDELKLKNVEGLAVMDAEKLEFPDNSFDVVMAQYVVTAVPNPEAALDEFARVLRPGGELDHPDPRQRRCRHAPLHRAAPAAGGSPARLPHRRVRLVALCAVAGRRARHGVGGAPPGAAARPFLAGALPQSRHRQGGG